MRASSESVVLGDEKVDVLLSRRTAVQALARTMRDLVRDAAPNAVEVIYHGALKHSKQRDVGSGRSIRALLKVWTAWRVYTGGKENFCRPKNCYVMERSHDGA
jgi:hypothetical protein